MSRRAGLPVGKDALRENGTKFNFAELLKVGPDKGVTGGLANVRSTEGAQPLTANRTRRPRRPRCRLGVRKCPWPAISNIELAAGLIASVVLRRPNAVSKNAISTAFVTAQV